MTGPYFRVFNPDTRAGRFDLEGRYRARRLPERDAAGGPEPIVDLRESCAMALAAFDSIRRQQFTVDHDGRGAGAPVVSSLGP